MARIDTALRVPFVLSGIELTISASVGIAFTGTANSGPELVLHQADLAMYYAKRTLAGPRQAHDQRDEHFAAHLGGLEHDLFGILERNELHTVYQPIVGTIDGRLTGVEALLRWTHPERGSVSPTVLIPLAEHSGMITEIGQWVLEQAWADSHLWQTADRETNALTMSVNVSTRQLMAPGFTQTVETVLATAETDPQLLTLELTEACSSTTRNVHSWSSTISKASG